MSFNMEIMAEIAFTKLFKLILSFGYWGSGVFFLDNIMDGQIMESIPIPTPLQNIAAAMFIAMTFARLVWFVYDKFFIETKERGLKMDREREEINGIRKKNRDEKS